MMRAKMSAVKRNRSRLVISLVLIAMLIGVPTVFSQARQLSLADMIIALRSKKAPMDEKNLILTTAVNERGITFELTSDIERELRGTGASDLLINSIRTRSSAAATAQAKPATITTASIRSEPLPTASFYREKARLAIASNDLNVAAADLTKSIEMDASDPESHRLRGDLYVKLNDENGALVSYSRAVELAPLSAAALVSRSTVYLRSGKQTEALADLTRAAELEPNDQEILSSIARIKDAQAKDREAQKAVAMAVSPVATPTNTTIESTPTKVRHNYIGSLNQYATRLAIPAYTANDRRLGIAGKVTVSITLDEDGKVVSVKATDGPRQLWLAAENAVKQSKFKPVMVDGRASIVTGVIVYNFTP